MDVDERIDPNSIGGGKWALADLCRLYKNDLHITKTIGTDAVDLTVSVPFLIVLLCERYRHLHAEIIKGMRDNPKERQKQTFRQAAIS